MQYIGRLFYSAARIHSLSMRHRVVRLRPRLFDRCMLSCFFGDIISSNSSGGIHCCHHYTRTTCASLISSFMNSLCNQEVTFSFYEKIFKSIDFDVT
jgi:hypothetical protein